MNYETQERCASYLVNSSHKDAILVAERAMAYHYSMIEACVTSGYMNGMGFHIERWYWWSDYANKRRALIIPLWKRLLKPLGAVFGYFSKGSDFYLPL